jgi:antitoxin component HigA of HigAB toxin-antitoxin module
MDIRLIATDTDDKEALAEVERLWGAAPGTPDEGKLELLAMLVHNYERSLEPLPPLDPVEAIKFRMDQQGLSRNLGLRSRRSEVRIFCGAPKCPQFLRESEGSASAGSSRPLGTPPSIETFTPVSRSIAAGFGRGSRFFFVERPRAMASAIASPLTVMR